MKKISLLICLIVIVGLLTPMWALASYDYYVPIQVYNNNSGALEGVPILVTLNNSQLADLGYINSSGLDTEVQEGSTPREFLVADARLGFFLPSIAAYQSRTLNYRLGESPEQGNFSVIVGDGGYFNISDDADLELGDNFSVEFDGWIDTSLSNDDIYPVVLTNATSTEDIEVTSHGVSLPSGIASGDLLLMLFSCYDPGNGIPTITWDSGWTELGVHTPVNAARGAAYKIANGLEGSIASVTTAASGYSVHQTFRIVDYQGTPEITLEATGTSVNPNSTSLSPSWGSSHTLWFSIYGSLDPADTTTVSSYPASYLHGQYTESSVGYAGIASARKEAAAASEDSGEFTLSQAVTWAAWTIGIEGGGSGVMSKDGAFHIYINGEGDLSARITAANSLIVTASVSSGGYEVEVWANTAYFGIDVDGVTENITALSGGSVIDNGNDWVVSNMSCMDYYEHSVNGTLEAWYLPVTMVQTTVLTDRSGNSHHGTITWGSNPSGIEISIGGLEPFSSYTAAETEEGEIPEVLPTPGTITPHTEAGVTGQGLPLQANFQRAADSLDWSLPVTYTIMFVMVAIVVGVAGLVGTGSTWGFVIGFGSTSAFFGTIRDSSGYLVMPLFITIICVMFAILVGYVWRYS